jgi:hypothetical protein
LKTTPPASARIAELSEHVARHLGIVIERDVAQADDQKERDRRHVVGEVLQFDRQGIIEAEPEYPRQLVEKCHRTNLPPQAGNGRKTDRQQRNQQRPDQGQAKRLCGDKQINQPEREQQGGDAKHAPDIGWHLGWYFGVVRKALGRGFRHFYAKSLKKIQLR